MWAHPWWAVAIPFITHHFIPIKDPIRYQAGLIKEPYGYTYVNRGIGTLVFPFRIAAPPEITYFILQKYGPEQINSLLEEDTLRIVNCGSMTTSMAEIGKEVDIENQYEYMGKAGGATTVFSVKESPVTIARLFRIEGKYGLVASEGHTLRLAKERFREARKFWPHALVKLDCNTYSLVQHIRSNHMHLCCGIHLDALKEFYALKDIQFTYPE